MHKSDIYLIGGEYRDGSARYSGLKLNFSPIARPRTLSMTSLNIPPLVHDTGVGGAADKAGASAGPSLKLKCHVVGEGVRLMSTSADLSVVALRQMLAESCSLVADSLLIQYKDEDNDMIIIKSNSDLKERIMQAVRTWAG